MFPSFSDIEYTPDLCIMKGIMNGKGLDSIKFETAHTLGQREYMEDHLTAKRNPDGSVVCAVFDGHHGDEVSCQLGKEFHSVFMNHFLESGNARNAMAATFNTFEDIFKYSDSGSTASAIHISGTELTWANVGDSRIALIGNKAEFINPEHRLTNHSEFERIKGLGGKVNKPYLYNNETGIMLTRSFGDTNFRKVGITAIPDIGIIHLDSNVRYIVLGTDGLFDAIELDNLQTMGKMDMEAGKFAEYLIEQAVHEEVYDNASVIVISPISTES